MAIPCGCRDIGLIHVSLGFLKCCVEDLLVKWFLRPGFWPGGLLFLPGVFCRGFSLGFLALRVGTVL